MANEILRNTVALGHVPAKAVMPGFLIAFTVAEGESRTGEVSDVYIPGTHPVYPDKYVIEINEGKETLYADAERPVELLRRFEVGAPLTAGQQAGLALLDTINAQGGLYERNGCLDTVSDWDEEGWPDLADTAMRTYQALKAEGVNYACLIITPVDEDED